VFLVPNPSMSFRVNWIEGPIGRLTVSPVTE